MGINMVGSNAFEARIKSVKNIGRNKMLVALERMPAVKADYDKLSDEEKDKVAKIVFELTTRVKNLGAQSAWELTQKLGIFLVTKGEKANGKERRRH